MFEVGSPHFSFFKNQASKFYTTFAALNNRMSQIWYISVMITMVIFNSAKVTFAYDYVCDKNYQVGSDNACYSGNLLQVLLSENSFETGEEEADASTHIVFVGEQEQTIFYPHFGTLTHLFHSFCFFILFESDTSPPLA
ncbi:hypothetical protein KEM09_15745 [Carboxylicivirga mesophila]|uniref:Uncharacterized protein n=1 Tax=Carboxylicivirga mesophila TaxID=1166478 RepID=A0ABS5KCW6_9BACT|nr:hypothetical protein [Carboxylicivirga mesophila]MBS2212871.1 hypothetical protein [Carboxylicivirga mesophila]